MRIEVDRKPHELAADVAALAGVDWARLWSEYPGDDDPVGWCESFGWKVAQVHYGGTAVRVEVSPGIFWDLEFGSDAIATFMERSAWSAYDDNGELVTAAVDDQWPAYVAALVSAFGTLDVHTTWDDPDFPVELWGGAEFARHSRHSPYRLAVWKRDMLIQLWINRTSRGGSSSIQLRVKPPV
jgi:hypothetical protein